MVQEVRVRWSRTPQPEREATHGNATLARRATQPRRRAAARARRLADTGSAGVGIASATGLVDGLAVGTTGADGLGVAVDRVPPPVVAPPVDDPVPEPPPLVPLGSLVGALVAVGVAVGVGVGAT